MTSGSESIVATKSRSASDIFPGDEERGVVRLGGRTITFASPEQRGALGIQMLPGGNGTFPDLSIRDNLEYGGLVVRDGTTLASGELGPGAP